MTTTITVEAHCSKDKVVEILINTGKGIYYGRYLKDGESWTGYIYEAMTIKIREEDNGVSE